MKTQYTLGPWYTSNTGNHQGLIISESTGENVAVSYDKKDAALISAAPELYAALEKINMAANLMATGDIPSENWPILLQQFIDIAKEAISKARGE